MTKTEQLALPMPEIKALASRAGIPRAQRVFVNRSLKMAGIDWVGFDMDYTLAVYDRVEMDALCVGLMIDRLREKGFSPERTRMDVDTNFPIRGLVIDKRFGHVLKLDRYRLVQKGYHGLRPLAHDEIRERYHSRRIRLGTQRYQWVDTLYGLSETALYVALIDELERHGEPLDYTRLFHQLRDCADSAYRDGTVPKRIMAEPGRFVRRDPLLAPTLHKLRSAGKRLFLLTNSPWDYTDRMMGHLVGDAMPEYPTWRHYFDVVITSAAKPAFFQERRPLLDKDASTRRAPTGTRSPTQFERGKAYEGGNLDDLERMLGVTGDKILYVGDHIYGDILRSKKEASWRTALILHELHAEVAAHEASHPDFERLTELNLQRSELEDELRANQTVFKDQTRQIEATRPTRDEALITAIEVTRQRVKRAVERVRGLLHQVDAETHEIEDRIDRRFHPYWGPLLKEGTELSSYGDQVQDYACIYTAQVSNLLSYSPIQYFRSPRDLMPHEV
jgi:HAD superfamily 5'-nucleotidase-like hydrolase